MDPTWGAGYLNDNKEFIASFSEDYFDPEEEDFQKRILALV